MWDRMQLVLMVVECSECGECFYDIYLWFLCECIIFFNGEVDDIVLVLVCV